MLGKKQRGQAALEYLSTYGWAVLVIALVLVALAWLGVFNVTGQVQDRCTLQGGLQCDSAKLVSGQQLTSLVITNRLTEPVYIGQVLCTNNPDKTPLTTSAYCTEPREGTKLAPGAQADVLSGTTNKPRCYDYFSGISSTSSHKVGDTYSGRLEIYYCTDYDPDGSKARIFYGDITLKVQP